MTRAQSLTEHLRRGASSFPALIALTGWSPAVLRTALTDLKRAGFLEAIPVQYVLTEKAMTTAVKIDWRRRAATRRLAAPSKAKRAIADRMVRAAMERTPNSVFDVRQ